MPLTDKFLEDTRSAIVAGMCQVPSNMAAPPTSELMCDLLARQLEVQIQIIESLKRIEEKLK